MIIGICGKAMSGKDTCCEVLQKDGLDIVRLALADRLKEIVAEYWGFTPEEIKTKPPFVRKTLQAVGRLMRDKKDPRFWVNELMDTVHSADLLNYIEDDDGNPTVGRNILITDVRFPNEAEIIHDFQGKLIMLHRDGAGLDGDLGKDQSEDTDSLIPYIDAHINNNGTKEELCQNLKRTLSMFKAL